MSEKRVVIGRIGAAYGIKGWVKIVPFTEDPESLFGYQPWNIQVPEALRTIKVESSSVTMMNQGVLVVESYKQHSDGWVAKLKDVNDRATAEKLRGVEIWIDEAQLPALEIGDYYWNQLEGLMVKTVTGQLLGKVDHLRETGSNDVLVVVGCTDSLDQRERWIPWIPEDVVKQVDLDSKVIVVDWDVDF